MSAPPVKKACDACHRRKVRCSGGQPCRNCGQASLQCTYLAIPQKKGPKGSRAKVISEIRDKQNVQTTSPTSGNHDHEGNSFDFNTMPLSPGLVRDPELLTQQTIDSCVTIFFSHLYPTIPIFSREKLSDLIIRYKDNNLEVHCLIASLCAFAMVQPGITIQGIPIATDTSEANARYRHASLLLDEVLRLRKHFDYIDAPTVLSVQTSFFMFSSFFSLERANQMWFHLREASTLAQILLMHEENTYRVGDPVENMYKRRLYWLILVTERAYAMERHRPLSLYATIDLPTIEEEPQEALALSGFLHLANLFRLIDEEFMALWNKAKSECSVMWLSQLQQQLADALPPNLDCTETQAADVRVTQHWLRTMVWQLSITNGYLSSSSNDVSMTFKYPIFIAQDLMQDVKQLSQQSMEVHGVGLIEKLFDVACTLTDVIACVPLDDPSIPSDAPEEFLNQLLNLISRLRGGSSKYQPLLIAKVSENLPSLTAYHDLPSTKRTLTRNLGHTHNIPSTLPTLAPAPDVRAPQSTPHSIFTATSPLSEHSRGLVFDAYSPSVSQGSDIARTPLSPPVAMSTSPFGSASKMHVHHMPRVASVPPRSNPLSENYESFTGQ